VWKGVPFGYTQIYTIYTRYLQLIGQKRQRKELSDIKMQDLNGNWTQDEPKVPGKGRNSQILRYKISVEIRLKMSQRYQALSNIKMQDLNGNWTQDEPKVQIYGNRWSL